MPTAKEKDDLQARKTALLQKTAAFCDARLDEEYKVLCARLVEKLARKRDVPFRRGDLDIWAAAIIHALGSANFLFDDSFEPHVRAPQIAEFFGALPRTVSQKAGALRDLMKLDIFNTEFTTEKMSEQQNSLQEMMMQMASAIGSPADVLDAPRFYTRAPEDGEFIDGDHDVMDEYYEIAEQLDRAEPTPAQEKRLRKLIARDPDFYDSYVSLAAILEWRAQTEEAAQLLDEASRRASARLTKESGQWPRVLEWAWLENRHIMRALSTQANNLWERGEIDGALELFRHLLAGDNEDRIGARFPLLAIRMNLSLEVFEELCDDPKRLNRWFTENYGKFPHEFSSE